MSITVEAVYENGVLKLSQPLPLKQQQRVEVTVKPKTTWVKETAELIPWTGTTADLELIALHSDFDPEKSARSPTSTAASCPSRRGGESLSCGATGSGRESHAAHPAGAEPRQILRPTQGRGRR